MNIETTKQAPALKKINFDQKEFTGKSGEVYYIQEHLSISRLEVYQRMEVEATFGTSFDSMFGAFRKIYDAVGSGNDVMKALRTVTEIAYNQMNTIKNFHLHDHHRILMFCTLFVNRAGENISAWDENLAKEKVADWDEYDVADFFFLAARGISGFKEAYSFVMQNEVEPIAAQ